MNIVSKNDPRHGPNIAVDDIDIYRHRQYFPMWHSFYWSITLNFMKNQDKKDIIIKQLKFLKGVKYKRF